MCNLDSLSSEERAEKAREILEDCELKQDLCLKCPGLTHKDIERTMKAVLAERHIRKEPTEEELYPEKYGNDPNPKQEVWCPGNRNVEYKPLTREQAAWLVEQSEKPIQKDESKPKKEYKTYSMEEVAALMKGDYHPDKFRYKCKKRK